MSDAKRAPKVVENGFERPESHREMSGSNRGLCQVRAKLPALANIRNASHGIELTQKKWKESEVKDTPGCLGKKKRSMGQESGRQSTCRQVGPEYQLGVAGHSPLKGRAGMVVGCRDLVQDSASGIEDASIAGPSKTESEVHVFIV
jgi:hypothetical protein